MYRQDIVEIIILKTQTFKNSVMNTIHVYSGYIWRDQNLANCYFIAAGEPLQNYPLYGIPQIAETHTRNVHGEGRNTWTLTEWSI